jgi:hypothetical protein
MLMVTTAARCVRFNRVPGLDRISSITPVVSPRRELTDFPIRANNFSLRVQLDSSEIWDVLKKMNLEVAKDKAEEVRFRFQYWG